MKRRIIFYPLLIIFLLLFYYPGRSIWEPIKLKLQNKKTVNEVLNNLDSKIIKKYSNISELVDGNQIALLIFKSERFLEVWKKIKDKWFFIKSFDFTASSGKSGPKLREGDHQIPEGIYEIEYLNPNSEYYLSLKIKYPNEFDKEKARNDKRQYLGGDIFIHGSDVTIGCIPIGNEAIEEVFYLVAKNGYANTKVIISPYDMRVKEKLLAIPEISWEYELYSMIKKNLTEYTNRT